MMEIPLVKGHSLMDCGVCCIATAMGVAWEVAASAIWPHGIKRRRRFGTREFQLRDAVLRLGGRWIPMHRRMARVKSWDQVDAVWGEGWYALVRVWPTLETRKECVKNGYYGHWLLYDGERVHCPQSGDSWKLSDFDTFHWRPSAYAIIFNRNKGNPHVKASL